MSVLPAEVSVGELVDTHGDILQLAWQSGQESRANLIEPDKEEYAGLVGFMNLIHPLQIPVLGVHEFSYLAKLDVSVYAETVEALFLTRPALIVIADDQQPSSEMLVASRATQIPLVTAKVAGQDIIDHFSYFLAQRLAARLVVHGVFMEVLDLGVLLTGASGMGKSELALELINRGHRLIADDSPVFARMSPDSLIGSCPAILQDFLEVRGLGIINVRRMFGDSAVKDKKQLHLVATIIPVSDEQLLSIDRLQGLHKTREILQVGIPEVRLPAGPGRSLAILVEAAVRHQVLQNTGYQAGDDFVKRHRKWMDAMHTESGLG